MRFPGARRVLRQPLRAGLLPVGAASGSRARLCGRLWTPPEPRWPAIGEHSGCVLKRPRTAAPARRRIRMIKAGTRPWGVVGGVGVAARVDGGRGVAGSCPLQSLLAAPFCRACAGVFPWSGERWGGTRVTWFGAARTNPCSCVVTYDHARRACFLCFGALNVTVCESVLERPPPRAWVTSSVTFSVWRLFRRALPLPFSEIFTTRDCPATSVIVRAVPTVTTTLRVFGFLRAVIAMILWPRI